MSFELSGACFGKWKFDRWSPFWSFIFHRFLSSGEYLGLTGEKLNGIEMITCGLATSYSLNAVQYSPFLLFIHFFLNFSGYWTLKALFFSVLQRLPVIEEQLGKLVTDDPSVIETTLEKYGDLVHPDSHSALQRFVLSRKTMLSDNSFFLIIGKEEFVQKSSYIKEEKETENENYTSSKAPFITSIPEKTPKMAISISPQEAKTTTL